MMNDNRIRFIQFEFGGCNIDSGTHFQHYFYYLNKKYKIYRILKDGLYEMKNYLERNEVYISTNYFAELR